MAVTDFKRYWSYTDLDMIAKTALMPKPKKTGLSDGQIAEIVTKIYKAEYDEAEMDCFLKVLQAETGASSDYIFIRSWLDSQRMLPLRK